MGRSSLFSEALQRPPSFVLPLALEVLNLFAAKSALAVFYKKICVKGDGKIHMGPDIRMV